jgi:hypothetical protein
MPRRAVAPSQLNGHSIKPLGVQLFLSELTTYIYLQLYLHGKLVASFMQSGVPSAGACLHWLLFASKFKR